LVAWQAFRITTKIIQKKDSCETIFSSYLFFPTCNFFLEYDSRFSVAPFQNATKQAPKRRQHAPSLSQQNDTTLRSASEQLVYVCRWHEILPRSSIQRCMFKSFSVRSLLRQPRSALEAGPSEAHAISFVHTSRPRLHRKGCTFSSFSALTKGIMGNH
jgi:hypothetical protein